MSATVLSRSYNNESPQHHHLIVTSGELQPTPSLRGPSTAIGGPRSSSMRRDRHKVSGSGMRISFASDTRFVERSLKSRSSSRSAASYNLRPVQGPDRPIKSKVRLPKATVATGFKYTTVSEDEYFNPRKALEIAKSYGIPKYFLRGTTQVLTDGRMRLFGDNVWKKERTSIDSDRMTADSSDVINRLMDSVDKAIATSKKMPPPAEEESLKLEIISLKSGADDKVSHKSSQRSLPGPVSPELTTTAECNKDSTSLAGTSIHDVNGNKGKSVTEIWGISGGEESLGSSFNDLRPHTVDTTPGNLVRFLPKMVQKDVDLRNSGKFEYHNGHFTATPQIPNSRSRQQASPFRGVSGSAASSNRFNSFDDKYQNVLPRFYPAVSAHKNRQAEAEKTFRGKKKSGHQRLVRFADTHTVRFSNDSSLQEPIAGLIAKRAPVQSIQRSLDSHSGLSQAERSRRLKEIPDADKDVE